jgi:hypothetical protein
MQPTSVCGRNAAKLYTAFGVPRSSIINERRSSSTGRNSLPKFALMLGTNTTMVSFFTPLSIAKFSSSFGRTVKVNLKLSGIRMIEPRYWRTPCPLLAGYKTYQSQNLAERVGRNGVSTATTLEITGQSRQDALDPLL